MKILLIGKYNSSEILSGPEKVAKRIFEHLQNENDEIIFVEYFFDGLYFSRYKKFFGKEKIEKNILRLGIFRFLIFILKFKPNVIHFVTFERFGIFSFLLKPFLKCKFIYHVHGVIKFEQKVNELKISVLKKIKDNFAEFFYYKFSDKIFFISTQVQKIAEDFYKIKTDRKYIIPNGVDDGFFCNQNVNKKINILFLAEKTRKVKGYDFASQIIKNLKIKSNIFMFSDKNQKDGNINFIKKMDSKNLQKFLQKIDIVVSTSFYEPFQIILLESIACGAVPILNKNVGLSDFIIHNKNGFIFEFGDVKKYSDCILKIAQNNNFREKIKKESLKIPLNLKWNFIVKKIRNGYSNQPKILHVLNNLDIVSGVTTHFKNIYNELEKKFDLHIALGKKPELNLKKDKNIFISDLLNYEKRSLINFCKALFFAIKIVRKHDFDIVHTHHFYHSFIFKILKIFGNYKVFLTVHGLIPNKGILPHFFADKLILVSNGNFEGLKKLKKNIINKATLIHNFLDEKIQIKKSINRKLKFIVASRLIEEKGILILLESLRILKNNKIDITIAGDGELSDKIKNESKTLAINFIGKVENINFELPKYDVLINPVLSDFENEGFPMIIQEAVNNNLGIISSNFKGFEFYLNNENSFIYEKNNPKRLAETIIFVSQNKKLLKSKSEIINKQFSKIFNKKENLIKLENIYLSN